MANFDLDVIVEKKRYIKFNGKDVEIKPLTVDGNIERHKVNAFLEFVVSRVAHHIFPRNFPHYSLFFEKKEEKVVVDAVGYIKENSQKEFENSASLIGVENVYAAAFYLGLEIRTPVYQLHDNLYVDDFSHSLHSLDKKQQCLIEEYGDHKISLSEEGTLFPQSFLNNNCGKWLGGKECDIKKLQDAYNAIVRTSTLELRNIVDDTTNLFAVFDNDYRSASEGLKSILIGNIDTIKELLQSEE